MQSLQQRLLICGCEIDHHESDLYVLDTPKAQRIIAGYIREGGKISQSRFTSNIDNRIWIDIPFMYSTYWENKQERR